MRGRHGLISLLMSLWIPAQALAAPTAYDIDFAIDGVYFNPAASEFQSAFPAIGITGSVVTDGTIGFLTETNLLSWDLFFSTPAFSNARSQSSDANARFSADFGFLQASADGRLLVFSNDPGFWGTDEFIGMSGLPQYFPDFQRGGLISTSLDGGGVGVFAYDSFDNQLWEIGTEAASVPAPVPLPAGIGLLASGLGGLVVLRKRRATRRHTV